MKAPRKTCTSKELLQLEHNNASPSPAVDWHSICAPKKADNATLKSISSVGESSVLNKVKAFLPVFDEANRKLVKAIEEKGAKDFDIEVLKEHEETSYIEMELALGVAELRSEEAVLAAQRELDGQVVGMPSPTNEDDDSGSEGEGNLVGVLTTSRKKRPRIESLS